MPNRILREGILTSEPVNAVSSGAELFYRRLMNVVDDFGRYFASPKILRSACFPLQVDRVREADISRWLTECETAGLIVLYNVGGTAYLQFLKLGEPRAKGSKYPEPPADASACAHVNASASVGAQTRPNADSGSNADSNSNPPSPPRGEVSANAWKTAKGVVIPEVLRKAEFLEAWRRWESHLRKKRVKTTDLADEGQLEKCVKWGPEFSLVCIKHSIAGNFQGVYAPKESNGAIETPRQKAARIMQEDAARG